MKKIVFALLIGLGIGLASFVFADSYIWDGSEFQPGIGRLVLDSNLYAEFYSNYANYGTPGMIDHYSIQFVPIENSQYYEQRIIRLTDAFGDSVGNPQYNITVQSVSGYSLTQLYRPGEVKYRYFFTGIYTMIIDSLTVVLPVAILIFSLMFALKFGKKALKMFSEPSAWDKEKKGYDDLMAETDSLLKGLK